MHKKFFVGVLVFILAGTVLTGCGPKDEKTRIKEAMIDIGCNVAKPMADAMKNIDQNDEAAMAKILEQTKDVETKMISTVQKHGFTGKDDFQTVSEKYEDDKAFEEEVYAAIKSACGFDMKESPGI